MSIEFKDGTFFLLENETWKVTETYTNHWSDKTKSLEYKIKSSKDLIRFLEVEYDERGQKTYSIWKKEHQKFFLYDKYPAYEKIVVLGNNYPSKPKFKGETYSFIEQTAGRSYQGNDNEKLICISYSNSDSTKFLSIEIWEDEIEVSTGIPLQASQLKPSNKATITKNPESSSFFDTIVENLGLIAVCSFIGISIMLSQCSESDDSWDSNDNSYESDTTIRRSNNHYRNRSFGGFGK